MILKKENSPSEPTPKTMLEAFSQEDVTQSEWAWNKNCRVVNGDTMDTYYSYILFKRPHIVLISDGCGIFLILRWNLARSWLLVRFSLLVRPRSCQIPSECVYKATLVSRFTYPEFPLLSLSSYRNSSQPVNAQDMDTRTVPCWQRSFFLVCRASEGLKRGLLAV